MPGNWYHVSLYFAFESLSKNVDKTMFAKDVLHHCFRLVCNLVHMFRTAMHFICRPYVNGVGSEGHGTADTCCCWVCKCWDY